MGTFKTGPSDSERATTEVWQGVARRVADTLQLLIDPPALDPTPTTLADGTISTVNVPQPFQVPPGSQRHVVPVTATLDEQLAAHAKTIAGVEGIRAFNAFEELDVARVEQVERGRRWRAEVGLLPAELDALLAPHGKTGELIRPHLIDELKRRARERAAKP